MELIKARQAKHFGQCPDQQARGTVAALTYTDNATVVCHYLQSSGASQLGLCTPHHELDCWEQRPDFGTDHATQHTPIAALAQAEPA